MKKKIYHHKKLWYSFVVSNNSAKVCIAIPRFTIMFSYYFFPDQIVLYYITHFEIHTYLNRTQKQFTEVLYTARTTCEQNTRIFANVTKARMHEQPHPYNKRNTVFLICSILNVSKPKSKPSLQTYYSIQMLSQL